ncbi:MAG: Uma2 family endonuclease, partial [Cyanobacteria bacterium P01_C01_bin.72]
QRHPYAQDIYWLIEVSKETLAKDLGEKSQTYARNGIPEYWIIDLVHKKLIVQTCPEAGKYQQRAEYTRGSISPLAFPKLKIALEQLLLF